MWLVKDIHNRIQLHSNMPYRDHENSWFSGSFIGYLETEDFSKDLLETDEPFEVCLVSKQFVDNYNNKVEIYKKYL